MKTLIISSSLSPESRSFILCSEAKKKLENQGVEVTLIDARELDLQPTHKQKSSAMENLSAEVEKTDTIIFGMGVHCYSVNDSLKMILDTCCKKAEGKFFGILCAAGGGRSYLATMHLTQICMNEFRMIQLPRVVYATRSDFEKENISNPDIVERIDLFVDEFTTIGKKLLN